MPPEETKFKF